MDDTVGGDVGDDDGVMVGGDALAIRGSEHSSYSVILSISIEQYCKTEPK